jgi:sigma-B regulation protein RsbU (phosphoserine phosphatase)
MSLSRAAQGFADALLEDDPVALYDRAPCGYLTTLPDGLVVKANSTFLDLTGYSEAEVMSMRLIDFLTPGGQIFHETHYAPLLRMQDSVRELALDMVRRDGSRLPVLLNASADRDATGMPRVIRIAVFEATERRRYERELVKATETAQRAQREAESANGRRRDVIETLQATLVPRALPEVEGLQLAGAFRPAGGDQLGGDFYDAFVVTDDECWLVLGDVSGKGVDAAVVAALVRNGARTLVLSVLEIRREPAEILRMLDRLVAHHETERFCTVAVVRLRRAPDGWQVSYASGGHPPALRLASDGTPVLVHSPGHLLGLELGGEVEQHEGNLLCGDTLLLYTDGVTEARSRDRLYGEDRLLRAAGSTSGAAEIVAAVLDDVMRFSDQSPRDDIACLAASVR